MPPVIETDVVSPVSLPDLEMSWRALEDRAAPSFFQSWSWVGCLFEERYPDPVLLRAASGGRIVGLALFNRRRGRLHLAETGDPRLDAPFIEHNGPLLAEHAGPATPAILLRAAWGVAGARRLRLSGVPEETLRAAGGMPLRLQQRTVPQVDLDAVRAAGRPYLDTLSANTRQQIRRSDRFYAARGPLRLALAGTAAEATAWLDALMELHGHSWRRRGRPGAFADAAMRRFHHALVLRAQARGELALSHLQAGAESLGYLYNVRHRGRVYAYQSGLTEAPAGTPAKPGLSGHAMAIGHALAEGMQVYDFLAGDHRYKRSLANRSGALWWAELAPPRSVAGCLAWLWRRLPRRGDHQAEPSDG